MSSHVAGRKMRMSKLLFIALVALYLVFMNVSAQLQDEVAGEADGDAVAPAGDGEGGDSQAAQDVVRSQMASSRGPTKTGSPSKARKGKKLKIAIAIAIIVILLTVLGGLGTYFFIRPAYQNYRTGKLVDRLKGGLPDGFEFKKAKFGDDKREYQYLCGPDGITGEQATEAKEDFQKCLNSKLVTKKDEGFVMPIGTEKQREDVLKLLGSLYPDDEKKKEEYFAGVVGKMCINGVVAKASPTELFFFPSKTKPEKVEPSKKQ